MSSLYNLKIRNDVLNPSLDDQVAPELSDIVLGSNKVPDIYTDPDKFFSITYITDTMRRLEEEISSIFSSGNKGRTILLFSFFGGGKTHSLIFLYHLFKFPDVAEKYNIKVPKGIKVVVIGGRDARTAPSPLEPLDVGGVRINTLWGYLAYSLGKFDLVKDLDENLTAPEKSRLEKLIGEDRVLILVDEIAFYLSRVATSVYSEYYKQCLNFFEILAQLTTTSPVVLIVTLPAQVENDKLRSERGYEEIVEALFRRIGRVAEVFESPISTDIDLVNVLRKRIFESVNVPQDLVLQYEKYAESFRDKVNVDDVRKLRDTYPFHPYYISVLESLLKYNRSLQKNRDAIRITRMVIRNLWNEKPLRDLVLASDINLRKTDFQNLLLKDYPQYKGPLDKMLEKTKGLAVNFVIANYIFLSTYIYNLGLNPREYENLLPSDKDVITAVFDLSFLKENNLTPADIAEKLNNLTGGGSISQGEVIPFLIAKDNRYWFTYISDPRTLCSSEARRVSELDVLNEFKRMTRELAIKGLGRQRESPNVIQFKDTVDSLDYLLQEDERGYNLYIAVNPISEAEIENKASNFIFYRAAGNSTAPRRYTNSITLLISTNPGLKEEITSLIKERLGCEKVDLTSYYQEGDVVRDVVKKLLESYKNDLESQAKFRLLSYYTKVVYPIDVNRVNIANLSISTRVLSKDVETTLINESKVLTDFTYDDLVYYLQNLGVNISNKKVSDIIEMFYTNPKLPWVRDDVIIRAIKDGVERLEIGIVREGKVYYKKTEENMDFSVTPDSTILSGEEAAKQQIEELMKYEITREEGDKVIREYWVLLGENERIRISKEIFNDPNWFYNFKNYKLQRISEELEKGVDINVEPEVIRGKVGESKAVKLRVTRIGSYEGKVTVESEALGKLEVTPDFEKEIPITITEEKEIEFTVSYDGKIKKAVVKVIAEKEKDVFTIPPDEIPQQGIIQSIYVRLESPDDLNVLNDVRKISGKKLFSGEFTISSNNGRKKGSFSVDSLEYLDFNNFVSQIITLFGRNNLEVKGEIRVNFDASRPMTEEDRKNLEELVKKGKIIATVRRAGA